MASSFPLLLSSTPTPTATVTATATAPSRVSAPTITQINCYCYPSNIVTVTISTQTPNAQIRWTNDGSEPTASNPNAHLINASSGPASGSNWYSVTFRAIAFKARRRKGVGPHY